MDKHEINFKVATLIRTAEKYPAKAQKAAIGTCKEYAKILLAGKRYSDYEVPFHSLFTRFVIKTNNKALIRSFIPVMEHLLKLKDSSSFSEGISLYCALFPYLSLFERQVVEDKVLNAKHNNEPVCDELLSKMPDSEELSGLSKNFTAFYLSAGYENVRDFWYGLGGLPYYIKVPKICQELKGQYDVGIGIAKGGLWSAYMFRQFGLPILLIDAHKTNGQLKWLGLDGITLTNLLSNKRVLLFDKDVVTGETLKMVSNEIAQYSPSALDLFILHSPGINNGSHVENIPSSIRKTYYPDQFPIDSQALKTAKDRFINTPALGVDDVTKCRAMIERAFGKDYADAMLTDLYSKLDIINQLDTTVPVIADLAKSCADALINIELQETLEPAVLKLRDSKGADMVPVGTYDGLIRRNLRTYTNSLLERIASRSLDKELKKYIAGMDNVDPHRALFYDLALSFSVISKLLRSNEYDEIVAVGPEAFSYAYLFELAGKKVLKLHVDEYDKTRDRPYRELDDLSQIKGKRVLLLEDDVVTGRTLEKVIAELKKHSPQSFSLFLGIPAGRQMLENIPQDMKMTYLVKSELTEEERTETLISLFGLLKVKPFHSGIMPFSLYL
jgi:hypoxanthine phosphoribosyltransferase